MLRFVRAVQAAEVGFRRRRWFLRGLVAVGAGHSACERCNLRLDWDRGDTPVLDDYLERLAARPAKPVLLLWTFCPPRRNSGQNAIYRKNSAVAGVTEGNSANGIHAICKHRASANSASEQRIRTFLCRLPYSQPRQRNLVSARLALTFSRSPQDAGSRPRAKPLEPPPTRRECTDGSCCVLIRHRNSGR